MFRCIMLLVLAPATLNTQAMGQQVDAYTRRRAGPPVNHSWGHPPRVAQDASVAAGGFQRPYPYHLDYYRKAYGGSYAPYFGNLYGPPNVVLGAAPYAGYGYAYPPPYAEAPPLGAAPVGLPGGAVYCPHCGEPLQVIGAPPASAINE